MIPIPKFILKKCLRPIWYFKFKAISLANTWWHGIWVKVKRPFWVEISSNKLMILLLGTLRTNEIQYIKYTSEYIPKLEIHQHSSSWGYPRINLCLSYDCVSFSDSAYSIDVKLD